MSHDSRPSAQARGAASDDDAAGTDASREAGGQETDTVEVPAYYAREIEARESIARDVPIDVYSAGINSRWGWPYRLVSAQEARPSVAAAADVVIVDSGFAQRGTITEVLDAGAALDADLLIPPDLTPGCEAYDPADPAQAREAAREMGWYTGELERHAFDGSLLVPIHPPVDLWLDELRHWEPNAAECWQDDPAFDMPPADLDRLEAERRWNARGARPTMTMDWIDKFDGVAVGGLIGLDVDERLAALRRVRERVGSRTHVHALAPGTEPRMIDALRAAPHLVDSLDVSTPERAPANGKLPDVSWTQHEIRVTEGTDSSTVRAAHSSGIALELARQLDPERFDRDAHPGRDAGQTGLDAFEDEASGE